MKYSHSFRDIPVSHFNGGEEYDRLARSAAVHDPILLRGMLLDVMRKTHGHNLRIDIELESNFVGEQGYLLDDADVEATVIKPLRHANLSLHPWFDVYEDENGATHFVKPRMLRAPDAPPAREEKQFRTIHVRATTENICSVIHARIASEFVLPKDCEITVRVWETADIYAEQKWGLL
jgi:6-pyruvoyl-tetrahydropterin synthase